jgi:hypothetical protein
MKAFDYNYVWRKTLNTFWRFPVVILLILLLTTSGIYIVYHPVESDIWQHLFLTSLLGIPLFIGINLFLERMETKRWFNMVLNLIGFAFLLLFFLNLPAHQIYYKHYIRAFLLICSFIASIFYLPFIGFERQLPFWYFNKNLIKRLFLSGLYAVVFFVGIAVALWAMDELFNVKIKSEWYGVLSSLAFFLFFPYFFLAGLSKKFSYRAYKEYYPNGLRLFTLYALVPINFIYALILLGYVVKIIISGIWPSGWTVGLITGYTLLEFLIIVFTYPVLFEVENKKLLKFIYINFYLTILFIIIYFLAVFQRVSQYGLTEHRLFTILWGLLVLFLVIYFLIIKIKDIRIIPFSFMLVAFIAVSGPWNVFRITKNSQTHRLESVLQTNKLLKNGKISANGKKITMKTQADISSIVTYLVSTHGPHTIKALFPMNVDSLFDIPESKSYKTEKFQQLFSSVGLSYVPYYYENESAPYYSFYTENKEKFCSTKNTDFMVMIDMYTYNDSSYHENYILNDSLKLGFELNKNEGILKITLNQKPEASLNVNALYEYFGNLPKIRNDVYSSSYKPGVLTTTVKGLTYQFEIYFDRLEFQVKDKRNELTSFSGFILLSKINSEKLQEYPIEANNSIHKK